jgi:hypothetical protein
MGFSVRAYRPMRAASCRCELTRCGLASTAGSRRLKASKRARVHTPTWTMNGNSGELT